MINDINKIKSKTIHKINGAWITLFFSSILKEQNIFNNIKSELMTNFNNFKRIKSFERVKEITYFSIFPSASITLLSYKLLRIALSVS